MKLAKRFPILAATLALCAGLAACQQASTPPVELIYSVDTVLYFVNAEGRGTKTFNTGQLLQNFAVSPSGKEIVFHSGPRENHGGALSIANIETGQIAPLTSGSYFTRYADNVSREVYSAPDFSPDGNDIVFAIHGSPNGDAAASGGPAAIMHLGSARDDAQVTVLAATTDPRKNGVTGYANSPKWSPDGDRIFVNFETGAALTDRQGTSLEFLSLPDASGADAPYSFAIDWVGPGCILYMAGPDWDTARNTPARLLNLETRGSIVAADLLPFSERVLTDVIAFSPRLLVSAEGENLLVESPGGESFALPDDAGFISGIHILNGADPSAIPASCR